VLCATPGCYQSNDPANGYAWMETEGYGISGTSLGCDNATPLQRFHNGAPSIELALGFQYTVVKGKLLALTPMFQHFSYVHVDNIVTTNASAPDATYVRNATAGCILTTEAEGTIPLQVCIITYFTITYANVLHLQLWFKQYNTTKWDYATLASPAGITWAQTNGYTHVTNMGYIFVDNTQF
jgi:hypothetical protein